MIYGFIGSRTGTGCGEELRTHLSFDRPVASGLDLNWEALTKASDALGAVVQMTPVRRWGRAGKGERRSSQALIRLLGVGHLDWDHRAAGDRLRLRRDGLRNHRPHNTAPSVSTANNTRHVQYLLHGSHTRMESIRTCTTSSAGSSRSSATFTWTRCRQRRLRRLARGTIDGTTATTCARWSVRSTADSKIYSSCPVKPFQEYSLRDASHVRALDGTQGIL